MHNSIKRDLFAFIRKQHGQEATNALKLACSLKLAHPDKVANQDALAKVATAYLSMLANEIAD